MSRLLGGQRAAHVVAVHLGQVAVEHDDVVGVDARLVERGLAVVGDVDGHALAAQARGPRRRRRAVRPRRRSTRMARAEL